MKEQTEFSVQAMCRVLNVSKSGYYEHLRGSTSSHDSNDDLLRPRIKAAFASGRKNYGTRRIKAELKRHNVVASRRRIRRLMREENLFVKTKRKFKMTTDSKHGKPIAPNLLEREFTVDAPDKVYVNDITYIHTREGWLYLAVVIDLFSRAVVGWSMNSRMTADLVNEALLMAILKRKPSDGLVSHSDRGSQYASDSHMALRRAYGITSSMSRKGDCWDNAVPESFFHTLKTELVYQVYFDTRADAESAIFEYIEVFYNRQRLHSANGYEAPFVYESMRKIT